MSRLLDLMELSSQIHSEESIRRLDRILAEVTMNRRTLITLTLALAVLIAACSPNQPAATPTVDQGLMGTSVAQTVEVMGTRVVSSLQTQLAPSATPPQTATPTTTPTAAVIALASPGAGQAGPMINVTSNAPITGNCNNFTFLADVTIPDGTMIPPGSPFRKIWAIKNTGTCAWNTDYAIVTFSGDSLSGKTEFPLLKEGLVNPGEMAVVAVDMVAPLDARKYTSYWRLRTPGGQVFGAGPGADKSLYAQIEVGDQYYFGLNQCSAVWENNNGMMYCPGQKDSPDGSFYLQDKPQLENGLYGLVSMVMVPPAMQDGRISAKFSPLIVPRDSYFRTVISCAFGRKQCNAHAYVTYSVNQGPEQMLAESNEIFDGFTNDVGVKLKDLGLADQSVSFKFVVETNGGPEDDVILWQNPRIAP